MMATKDRYDRQLRLWGASGQKSLYESIIVLIHATAAGTETIKNLVLPGIGSFHIVDDQWVSSSPTCSTFSNFFTCPAEVSTKNNGGHAKKSRAEVATVYLSELNHEVVGRYTTVHSLSETDFTSLLRRIYQEHSQTDDMNDYDNSSGSSIQSSRRMFVIAADLPPTILLKLSSACWNYGSTVTSSIPLVVVRSYGLIGTVRIQVQYHPIIESKPDHSVPDLRIINAFKNDTISSSSSSSRCLFPTLRNFADEIHLETLDSQSHSHVPYVVILIKALDLWMEKHSNSKDGGLPKTLHEKESLRQIIQALSHDMSKELNFQEALENSYLAYAVPTLPYEVQVLMDNLVQTCNSSIPLKSSFEVMLLALHRFMLHSSHQPPIHGSIPDMTSNTEQYIKLQQLYKNKAEEDRLLMKSFVDEIIRTSHNTSLVVTEEQLTLFCKNVNNLRLIHTRSLEDEYAGVYSSEEEREEIMGTIASATCDVYEDPHQTPLLWYIVLRACDLFYHQYGKFPGNVYEELEIELQLLKKAVVKILEMMSLKENEYIVSTLIMSDAHLREMIRFNNAEIHSIASLVAGVASQEAVKLITGQFVPIDGTFVLNGIASVGDSVGRI